MAGKIEIYRGTATPVIYNHTDSSGAPVPLTNKTLYFTVKAEKHDSSVDDSTAIIKKTITSHTGTIEGYTLNAATGVSGFYLTDSDTYKDPGKYYYVFLVEDNTTFRTEPPSVFGTFTILANQSNRQVANG